MEMAFAPLKNSCLSSLKKLRPADHQVIMSVFANDEFSKQFAGIGAILGPLASGPEEPRYD